MFNKCIFFNLPNLSNTDSKHIAPPVRFSVLPDVERNKSTEAGSTITLQCELSDPLAQVSWYKDGVKLLPEDGLDIKSEGKKRKLTVQSAEFYHSGVYSCKTRGDAVHFNVEVKGDLDF